METLIADYIASDRDVDDILRRYPELPRHYIATLLGKPQDYSRVRERLAARALIGQLIRYDWSNNKISKHSCYALKEVGIRNKQDRPHRLLQSIEQADIEIGATEDPDFEFISWQKMITMKTYDGKPVLPRHILAKIDAGEDPHFIPLDGTKWRPDGAPYRIYYKPTKKHKTFIDEIDRDTQPLTSKTIRETIESKFKAIHEFYDKEIWATHYGFENCLTRIISTNVARTQAMMRLWETMYGPKNYIFFGTTKDWYYEPRFNKKLGVMFKYIYNKVDGKPFMMNVDYK